MYISPLCCQEQFCWWSLSPSLIGHWIWWKDKIKNCQVHFGIGVRNIKQVCHCFLNGRAKGGAFLYLYLMYRSAENNTSINKILLYSGKMILLCWYMVSICALLAVPLVYDLHFPLWLNWGIFLTSSLYIEASVAPVAASVATSTCCGTFANIAFCEHFCSTGEAGISGGGRSRRAHPSFTWTWHVAA